MQHILAAMCTLFAVYMLGGLIAWDMNPGNWPVAGRITVIAIGVWFAMIPFPKRRGKL
jgi:hypothetical protein